MKQLEIKFTPEVQLEINWDEPKYSKIINNIGKQLKKLVSCHCGQCDHDCGCVIEQESQKRQRHDTL